MSFIQAKVLRAVGKDELDAHKAAGKGPYHSYSLAWAGYQKCEFCGHMTSQAVFLFAADAAKANKPNATQWTERGGFR